MTALLHQAFSEAAKLPPTEQDLLASRLWNGPENDKYIRNAIAAAVASV